MRDLIVLRFGFLSRSRSDGQEGGGNKTAYVDQEGPSMSARKNVERCGNPGQSSASW